MKSWICECGQVCIANENPTDSFPKWKDGHVCVFKLDNGSRIMSINALAKKRDEFNDKLLTEIGKLSNFGSDCTCEGVQYILDNSVEVIVNDQDENVLHRFCSKCGGVI